MQKMPGIHPLTGAIREIVSIFEEMGFSVAAGPERESEHYNFDALNVAKDHPSRDMQDTFWLPDGRVMRTHTSPVQVRFMEAYEPPIRVIVPGKVYRNEATDMTHEAQFYQIEGLVVDTDTTLGHLKGTLEQFFGTFFGGSVEVRLRPSYFPFVEPGLEVDMRLTGDGVPPKLKDKWVEVMGAGMVHPRVLSAAGVDPHKYQGFAFGGGIERLCMLKWGIDDVRVFHTGDLRLVSQFVPTQQ
jgi:phenylalanyl-tRNA synthetase alpha chain